MVTTAEKTIVVALAGSPNVGKSTVFNLLTGLSQHVGNWPGKTVEQKVGVLKHSDATLKIVDLPGTYSLTANSLEEQIARDYLVNEHPDIVVAVLNAASLERNLYLVAELIELSPRLIIALNMIDVAIQQGMKIDTDALSKAINIPIIPIVASKNQGLNDLVEMIVQVSQQPLNVNAVKHIEYGSSIGIVINHVENLLNNDITSPYPLHWTAMKLLEGDEQINRLVKERMPPHSVAEMDDYLRENESAAVTIATLKFRWVEKMAIVAQEKPAISRVSLTEKIDRIATHPVAGLFLLISVMGLIFAFVYSLGIPLQDFLEVHIIQALKDIVAQNSTLIPIWLQGFINDAVLSGVGTVLTFIPILFFFFMAFAVIEDTGYMARAAFVTDRFMHFLGLHGKSCLPLVLGFGCNVPAVLGTRIIDSKRARMLTILLAPLVPCTGRMAVVTIIAATFFGNYAILVSIGIVIFSLLMLMVIGFLLNKFFVKGESASLIMELPLYHIPSPRTIGLVTWQSLKAFIKRAGTVILVMSIIVWLLSIIPDGTIENSILAMTGKWLEPVGQLMGLNWQMMVALLSSFVAKENTIATLGVLLSGEGLGLSQQLNKVLTPAAALAFLIVQVLFIPCVATIAAIRQETNGWRWPIFVLVFQLIVSFAMAIAVYQLWSLID